MEQAAQPWVVQQAANPALPSSMGAMDIDDELPDIRPRFRRTAHEVDSPLLQLYDILVSTTIHIYAVYYLEYYITFQATYILRSWSPSLSMTSLAKQLMYIFETFLLCTLFDIKITF